MCIVPRDLRTESDTARPQHCEKWHGDRRTCRTFYAALAVISNVFVAMVRHFLPRRKFFSPRVPSTCAWSARRVWQSGCYIARKAVVSIEYFCECVDLSALRVSTPLRSDWMAIQKGFHCSQGHQHFLKGEIAVGSR